MFREFKVKLPFLGRVKGVQGGDAMFRISRWSCHILGVQGGAILLGGSR